MDIAKFSENYFVLAAQIF